MKALVFQLRDNFIIHFYYRSALMTALAVLLPVVFVLVLVALVLSWRTKVFHIQVSTFTNILNLQLYYIFK